MAYKVSIVLEKDEYGYYAYCPELPGCQSQGYSLEKVQTNIQEAVEFYIETLSRMEEKGASKQGNFNNDFGGTSCLNFRD